MSSEADFWGLSSSAAKVGITKSRLGLLLKLCHNYDRALQILQACLRAKAPSAYLGKVISNMRYEQEAPQEIIKQSKKEPEIATDARLRGWPVRKTALSNGTPGWWIAGVLYNERGVDVGW